MKFEYYAGNGYVSNLSEPPTNGILVGVLNGSSIQASHTALLPFPQLPIGACQSNVFPDLGNRNLISIGQICDHGLSAIFTSKGVSLTGPNTTLTGMRKTDNGLYYIDLQNIEPSTNAHLPQH